ncbi:MAG TPA: ATP-binding cassette domain-containing protein [Candidatus Limnocylindrales bacterium]|jgi:ABC-2 type transport system ATP-binding protein|nr:ATP-binding cassette domain-containing protein [Candidatus Limnocylindrales bacterium]
MQTIELSNVRKTYEHFVAVDGISFAIEQGTVFGLLGPNGAGKTSTIRMMIGITQPDSGQINVFGKPFERKSLERIGYLPEERGLYKKMKVLDQLVFLAELHGMSRSDAGAKAQQWCERLDIAEKLQSKVEELSKGMQQKIQFIAALLHEPDFVIMDEPFYGLDPVNAGLLKDVLLDLKKQGKTILFSTHRMDQVEKLCDSICLIDRGRAVLQGPLSQVKSKFGKNNVQIEYVGNDDFLHQTQLVGSYNNYGNYVEVRLAPGADSQELLRAVASRSRVNKFELMEPSLEEIFKEVVGKTDA